MQVLAVSKVIVVNAEGKILLLRRSPDDNRRPNEWDIPGGHVDEGEYPAEAAARETREEAGIAVSSNDLVLLYAMTEIPENAASVTWLFHRARTAATEVILSEEHKKYRWATLQEALQLITYERQHRALKYVADHDLLNAGVS